MDKCHCFSLHDSKKVEPAEVSPDRWMDNEMWWCLYPVELYSAIRERESTKSAGKWFDLEYIILCEYPNSGRKKSV